jgi:hypothetical protein
MENNIAPQIPDDASDLEKIFKEMKDAVKAG